MARTKAHGGSTTTPAGRNRRPERDALSIPAAAIDPASDVEAAKPGASPRLSKTAYEAELRRLAVELVKWEEWIKARGLDRKSVV